MATPVESSSDLPGYDQLQEHAPGELEKLMDSIENAGEEDLKWLLENPAAPDALYTVAESETETRSGELTEIYDYQTVNKLLSMKLLQVNPENLKDLQLTFEGKRYIQMIENFDENGEEGYESLKEEDSAADSDSYIGLLIHGKDFDTGFEDYETYLETTGNFLQDNTTTEEKIDWDNLPETPEEPEKPDWIVDRSNYGPTDTGPDWIQKRKDGADN